MSTSQRDFLGDAEEITVTTSDIELSLGYGRASTSAAGKLGRVKVLTVNNAGRKAKLPKANELPLRPGGPVFYIVNKGPQSIVVVNQSGATQVTLFANDRARALLRDGSTVDGSWIFFKRGAAAGGYGRWATTQDVSPIAI